MNGCPKRQPHATVNASNFQEEQHHQGPWTKRFSGMPAGKPGTGPLPAWRPEDRRRVHYERRRPEDTALYQLVQEHLETFLAQVELETGSGVASQVQTRTRGRNKRDSFHGRIRRGRSLCDSVHGINSTIHREILRRSKKMQREETQMALPLDQRCPTKAKPFCVPYVWFGPASESPSTWHDRPRPTSVYTNAYRTRRPSG